MLSARQASFAPQRFELLTLGDELLLGLTANGHLEFIGAQLSRRGVTLLRNVTLTDDAAAITEQFRESWARSDVVITTGGLGPTCDDRTRESVAEVLGQKLVFDPAIEQAIIERFAKFGRKMTPNNLKQAQRPERAQVLANANGTAPGLWIEQDGKIVCLLPGPPNEMQPMFTEQVLPRLAQRGLLLEREAYVQIRTAGIGESALETKLQPIFERHGEALGIAFCAHVGHVDCRLGSPAAKLSFDELQAVADDCARLLREDFVCFGHDSLGKVCADLLRAQEKTLAVAEAATGGLLANAFTDICGAAKFLPGAASAVRTTRRRSCSTCPSVSFSSTGRSAPKSPWRWRPARRRSSAPTMRWPSPDLPGPAAGRKKIPWAQSTWPCTHLTGCGQKSSVIRGRAARCRSAPSMRRSIGSAVSSAGRRLGWLRPSRISECRNKSRFQVAGSKVASRVSFYLLPAPRGFTP
jgi:nicotinamide-nucleotide amidase